jgi:hypothetical protein
VVKASASYMCAYGLLVVMRKRSMQFSASAAESVQMHGPDQPRHSDRDALILQPRSPKPLTDHNFRWQDRIFLLPSGNV